MRTLLNSKHAVIAAVLLVAGLTLSTSANAYTWAATYPAAGSCVPMISSSVSRFVDDGLYNSASGTVYCGVPRTTDLNIGDIYKVQLHVTDNNYGGRVSARLMYRKMSTGQVYAGGKNYSSAYTLGVDYINAYANSDCIWSTASTYWAAYVQVQLVANSGVIGYRLYRK